MDKIIESCKETITTQDGQKINIYNPRKLFDLGLTKTKNLPFSIVILLEQALRNYHSKKLNPQDIKNLLHWSATKKNDAEIPFMPTRVVLQDFTGVPSLVDLAALRDAMTENNLDPAMINPQVPVDLIIDHSIQVDSFGTNLALEQNMKFEFQRNKERYEFLKWGQEAFDNLRIFPPGAGIIHQINLEHLSESTHVKDNVCFPDTLVGTDSHTTMINALGVIGWGVGGIEAESVILGQPIYMKTPEVVGFKMINKIHPEVSATDLVLRVTEILRQKGVVEKFIEFFGPGLSSLSLADRATISNMSPEYGATMGYFPVDNETLNYLRKTGRSDKIINRAEQYYKQLGIFREDSTVDPEFSDIIELDLSTIQPSIAGPKRPQDRIGIHKTQSTWQENLIAPVSKRGFGLTKDEVNKTASIEGYDSELKHGDVVIAAITSCTNTSNPILMISAGCLAKNALDRGLKVKPWVKTSLAPGSRVVTDYLEQIGLQPYFDKLGFNTVGYGCTTCIGNSGPLDARIEKAIKENNLVVCSVLSGNRNFEGRIHNEVKANFLASPTWVVAYALAGTMNIDILNEPIGQDRDGKDVLLKEIWPSTNEVKQLETTIQAGLYTKRYANIHHISEEWNQIESNPGKVFNWKADSTYIQKPPFFNKINEPLLIKDITGARVLLELGDSITTDHISPAGGISEKSPAGLYLKSKNISKADFNSYGSRRGNDRIMERGTFANVRIRNLLLPGTEGGITKYFPNGQVLSVFEAAQFYKQSNTPTIVIAGAEYGSGSSRDWAAKGPYLLGVKAIIAVSFERIHRSNLIGMGILPLQFLSGQNSENLNITGQEVFDISGINEDIKPKRILNVRADNKEFEVLCRLDTDVEVDYYLNGGILHTFLRNAIQSHK